MIVVEDGEDAGEEDVWLDRFSESRKVVGVKEEVFKRCLWRGEVGGNRGLCRGDLSTRGWLHGKMMWVWELV